MEFDNNSLSADNIRVSEFGKFGNNEWTHFDL